MAKIKINKLPKGFKLVDGKVVEDKLMQYGGDMHLTGDQADYGLVTTPQEYYGQTMFNNTDDQLVRFSLSGVPREDANIEAEGGETVLTDLNNNGDFGLYNITGPRHSQGGVPMFLPEQSFIYSDTPKLKFSKDEMSEFDMGGSRKTPAQISKKFGLNNYYAELNSQFSDNISSRSAELMLKKNMEDLSKLSFMQEAKKNFEDGVPLASHPFLLSQGLDPLEFTANVEQISMQQAQNNAFEQLPSDQQDQLRMLQQMLAQAEQQQSMPAQNMQAPAIDFANQMDLSQANNDIMPMARFGNEMSNFLNKAQAGTETDAKSQNNKSSTTSESFDPLKYFPEGSDTYKDIQKKQSQGFKFSLTDEGKLRYFKPASSKFEGRQGNSQTSAIDIVGSTVEGDPIYSEDERGTGEVINQSDIGYFDYGMYSEGNIPGTQYSTGNQDSWYGSDAFASKEAEEDWMRRVGRIASKIKGFDYNKGKKDPQWLEFQKLYEQERKKFYDKVGAPYRPYFGTGETGSDFDGKAGTKVFNAPGFDIDFTAAEEGFIDLPKEKEKIKTNNLETTPGPIKEVWRQDQNNLMALAAIQDDLYLPWSPKLDEQKIDYVLDDYTGKVNAIMGAQNTMATALGAAGGPQAIARSDIQGKSLNAIAQAIDTTNRTNVNIMNRAAAQQAQMDAQIDMRNKAIDKGLYDDTVFALQEKQNFDNEKIAKNNELFNAMMTNAANTYNLNTLYPYYNVNPQGYGDVEFTENGQQLYKANQVDQQEAFLDAYTKLRKNLPADQKIDAAFLDRYLSLGNSSIPAIGTTKGQADMQQRGIPGYPGSNVQLKKGKEIKKLPKSFPFFSGKMGV